MKLSVKFHIGNEALVLAAIYLLFRKHTFKKVEFCKKEILNQVRLICIDYGDPDNWPRDFILNKCTDKNNFRKIAEAKVALEWPETSCGMRTKLYE